MAIQNFDCALTEEFFYTLNIKHTERFDRQRAKYLIDFLDRSKDVGDIKSDYLGYQDEGHGWHSLDVGGDYRLWFKYGNSGPTHVKFEKKEQ